jgi:hypothetical protein
MYIPSENIGKKEFNVVFLATVCIIVTVQSDTCNIHWSIALWFCQLIKQQNELYIYLKLVIKENCMKYAHGNYG